MGSSFGKLFSISTFGESHGGGVGVIIDGCPPRLELDINQIQNMLFHVLNQLLIKEQDGLCCVIPTEELFHMKFQK